MKENNHLDVATPSMFQTNVPFEVRLSYQQHILLIDFNSLVKDSHRSSHSFLYPISNASNGLINRIFGCVAFVHIHSQFQTKLVSRAQICEFVDYSSTQKLYKCYHGLICNNNNKDISLLVRKLVTFYQTLVLIWGSDYKLINKRIPLL